MVTAVLSIELAEDVGFIAGISVEQGVDVLSKGFGFGQSVLSATIFEVGEVAY